MQLLRTLTMLQSRDNKHHSTSAIEINYHKHEPETEPEPEIDIDNPSVPRRVQKKGKQAREGAGRDAGKRRRRGELMEEDANKVQAVDLKLEDLVHNDMDNPKAEITLNLPPSGTLSFIVEPVEPQLVFLESWQRVNIGNKSNRDLVQNLLARTQCAFGECVSHFYINGSMVQTNRHQRHHIWTGTNSQRQKLFAETATPASNGPELSAASAPNGLEMPSLPAYGTVSLSYVVVRPQEMTNCMDSTSCTFDLAKTEDYNKAMFLREHVLGTESLVMPYWSEVTLDHKQVRFIQVCSRDLWQLPRAGILRFTFISFQMHEPMPESLLGFILKLLQDTPSDCERARIIRNIFKCPDTVFRLTCAMVKTVLDLFADRETKSQVYPHLKRHTVDLQNSLDFEFGLAVEPLAFTHPSMMLLDRTLLVKKAVIKLKKKARNQSSKSNKAHLLT